jgi:hypothetical protein
VLNRSLQLHVTVTFMEHRFRSETITSTLSSNSQSKQKKHHQQSHHARAILSHPILEQIPQPRSPFFSLIFLQPMHRHCLPFICDRPSSISSSESLPFICDHSLRVSSFNSIFIPELGFWERAKILLGFERICAAGQCGREFQGMQ